MNYKILSWEKFQCVLVAVIAVMEIKLKDAQCAKKLHVVNVRLQDARAKVNPMTSIILFQINFFKKPFTPFLTFFNNCKLHL
ncbi:hypothetical protein FFL01_17700 [Flavobacterium flevense]|uniref:Uncharacterized protein n=1 Tax=Flavobacterium flevense TaxID=983 RepID=A0A4Y4AVI1_9FLAO|nr:hypothetical protein FFL01_17700 [Flavobacterium flevense]